MFGMLDYRAHKLYALLVYPIAYALRLISIFGLPIISYLIAAAYTSTRLGQSLLTILIYFLIGIPWTFLVKFIIAIPEAVFYFLIDPLPADGRNKEEAKAVVQSGEKAIKILAFNKPASEWSDEMIENIATGNFFSFFFQNKIRNRLYAAKAFYMDNPSLEQSAYVTNNFLRRSKLEMNWFETVVTNLAFRGYVLQVLTLFIVLIAHPF